MRTHQELKYQSNKILKKYYQTLRIIKWCQKNDYTFKLISEDYFIKNWNKIKFNLLDKNSIKNLKKIKG